MNSPNQTINLAYVHDPKAARSKKHGVVHYYQRPDGVRFSEHTFWPDEATARAVVAGGLK